MAKAPTKPEPAAREKYVLSGAFSLFKPSWEAVQLNLITFLELFLTPIILSIIVTIVAHRSSSGPAISLFTFAIDILSVYFGLASFVAQLASVRGEKIDFMEALQAASRYFWRYIGLVICMTVVIFVGLLLLIVPGLIMIRRYYLAPYYLIDRDMKVFDAMRASADESKPVSGAVWGVIGVSILFGLLIFVLIGFVLSFMYACAPALRYLQIRKLNKV